MKKFLFLFLVSFAQLMAQAQFKSDLNAQNWTDSVFKSLGDDEKIAQLIVIRAFSTKPEDISKVADLIKTYNVGALCFFQSGPIRQATATNYYQSIAKTPLLVTIDGEWGLGMRLDSVTKYPYQLTLGALSDPSLIYQMGVAVGEQCKRIGVQVNFAPVVDINNNPNNPVIGYRSFGENKNKVTEFGLAYMKGMQDVGIMACAKHFPGHGDVDVDSHLDLPVINKSMAQLDTLELVPFKALFKAGVGSVMIAHLYIPAIDSTANTATSLSKNNVTGLLRNKLGYQGLTFTDALEMKGVAKYWPGGEAAVQALIAGNDMLCLPESVPDAIAAIKTAISQKRLNWNDIDSKVKKVLLSKYELGLNHWKPVDTTNLVSDLNQKTNAICYEAAKKTITVLNGLSIIPQSAKKIAYVGIGVTQPNILSERLREQRNADCYFINYSDSSSKASAIREAIDTGNYDAVVIGVHGYNLKPMNNYGITDTVLQLWNQLQPRNPITLVFGNVLAIKDFCSAKNLVACYQDDEITQLVAADLLEGSIATKGTLPVSVCQYRYGAGIMQKAVLPQPAMEEYKFKAVDSIAEDAIAKKAFPGCVILATHKGKIVYDKAFGNYEYGKSPAMSFQSIFDLASVTKVSATTISIMRLYDEGKIDLNKTLGDYLPWTRGTDKAPLKIHDILLHQAGLVAFISFYKEVVDSATGISDPAVFSEKPKPGFSIRVAEHVYMRNDWEDTMFQRILKSRLGPEGKYVYSDLDFILLGKIVETVTSMPLNQYVQKTFYNKIGLETTGFLPGKRFPLSRVVPTEEDKYFRHQIIQGDVHDEGAAMFGGVAGHAGLFSDAYDLAMLYQMLANGGEINGERYIKKETIKFFSEYHSKVSRRGYGFDKPDKDNATRKEPYPSVLASPETFGHTGFTGTCVWVDPKYDIVYIFLSNRVYPTRHNIPFSELNVRSKIQDAIYRGLGL
ncbi:MAG: serine hydrolase [Bacteroidetes bacterium]|nr:serine hydrolase [Bacteroidota bacterium]MBS1631499.1 serine hydrolase [Bacteroidota bacterium]